jgi:hypothetical protein
MPALAAKRFHTIFIGEYPMHTFHKILTHTALFLLLSAPLLAATQEQPAMPHSEAAPSGPVLDGSALQGTIVETMNAAGYTYLLLDRTTDKIWVAIPETPVKTGQVVTCTPGMTMNQFASKTLQRTFDTIVFSPGIQVGTPQATANQEKKVSKAQEKPVDFSAALEAEKSSSPAAMGGAGTVPAGMGQSTGSLGAIVPSAEVSVIKATGPNSYSVGECFEQAKELNTKTVRVRGKVMKISRMIMGKNWVHIQDGTGNPLKNMHDLVITTQDEPGEGEVVTVEGILSANRDFGAGYTYAVIIENAKVEK